MWLLLRLSLMSMSSLVKFAILVTKACFYDFFSLEGRIKFIYITHPSHVSSICIFSHFLGESKTGFFSPMIILETRLQLNFKIYYLRRSRLIFNKIDFSGRSFYITRCYFETVIIDRRASLIERTSKKILHSTVEFGDSCCHADKKKKVAGAMTLF